ncbi:MAG TPA: sigma-54-dependent Fis family transcriptional regulator [Bacteroidetes bacterium]|nr:sigma-54-dependent Fis family transcriptional regulator [Bacteroidota bacterium]
MYRPQNKTTKFEETIVGESPQIKAVIAQSKKIAKGASFTTLITGESGTGKELFARLLHNFSPISNQPFVDINCGAIPETLLESELFGYEKGAFTGAHLRKQGLFELANGGTIFLDEIGNTTTNFQMKLLKAVENKKFRRIGGLNEVQISTRIVAATNVNMEEAVKNGKFREDLYYRLNVFQIRIPPLRERGDDIFVLANYFIDQFNKEYDRQVRGLTPSAKALSAEYHWPGNVRQLKNAIERAVLVETDDWIEDVHLSLDSNRNNGSHKKTEIKPQKEEPKILNHFNRFDIPDEGISLEEIEKDIILSAIDKAEGNLSKAARLLRMTRGKFRYRIDRLDISLQELVA